MKLSFVALSLWLAAASVEARCAGGPLCLQPHSSDARFQPNLPLKRSAANAKKPLSSALSIPRGGGKTSTVDVAKMIYYVLFASHGLISALAADKVGPIIYNKAFSISEGSLSSMLMEYVGTGLIGLCYMAMLATKSKVKTMSAANIVAHGVYPCTLLNTRNILKGNFAKLGWKKGYGMILWSTSVILPIAIRSGKFDSDLLATIGGGFIGVLGLAGIIDTRLGKTLAGLPSKGSAADDAFARWMFSAWTQQGIMSLALLNGESGLRSVGYSTLFFLLDIIDVNFIRKTNKPIQYSKANQLGFVAALVFMSYAFLKK